MKLKSRRFSYNTQQRMIHAARLETAKLLRENSDLEKRLTALLEVRVTHDHVNDYTQICVRVAKAVTWQYVSRETVYQEITRQLVSKLTAGR